MAFPTPRVRLPRRKIPGAASQPLFPKIAGLVVCGYAVLCLILGASTVFRLRLQHLGLILDEVFLPLPVPNIAWAVFLFVVGLGLYKRKRLFWAISVLLLMLLNVGNAVVYGLLGEHLNDPPWLSAYLPYGVVFQFFLLVLMLTQRRAFAAHTVRSSWWQAGIVWAVGTFSVFIAGVGLLWVFPGSLDAPGRVLWSLNHAAAFSLVNRSFYSGTAPLFVSWTISILSAIVFIVSVFTLLRSQKNDASLATADETALRALIGRFNGEDSLAYFATRRDKSVVFEPNGRAAVTYRVEAGVSMASGDPLGDPAYWNEAVAAWLARSEAYGSVPAVMGASERGARVFEAHGLRCIHLGDEAVLNTRDFHISELKEVRQARAHAVKQGVTVEIRRHDSLKPEELDTVSRLAEQWRTSGDERGFSMALGRLGDPADGQCLLVEARRDGELVGLLSFVPWGRRGVSLDVMRRRPDSPNGVIEAMVAALAADEDIDQISLNFAVFRELFASEDKVAVSGTRRLTRRVLVYLSRWWQMESLYRANAKYNPMWVPRYLCFPDSLSMARVAIASGIVEGFLPSPLRSSVRENSAVAQPEAAAALRYAEVAQKASLKRQWPEQTRVRIAKVDQLRAQGVEPWPAAVGPSSTCAAIAEQAVGTPVRIAGRVIARRSFGGVAFVDVRDATGTAQVIVEPRAHGLGNRLGIDLGDLIAVEGTVRDTLSGRRSVWMQQWRIEAKSLHPSARRKDATVLDPTGVEILKARSQVLTALRGVLTSEEYLEVETPVLQPVHGGANARPFTTYLNALNQELYLRIAPELYLKRLLARGMDRVFELGRVFRNEGVDATHNPEFTSLEAYCAHGDYDSMRELAQRLIKAAARAVHGDEVVRHPETGGLVSLAGDWPIVRVHEAVSRAASERLGREVSVSPSTPRDDLVAIADELGISWRSGWNAGEVVLELYEHLVEAQTREPTFYIDFPTSVSPLTRQHRQREGVAERWDLVAWGVELGTAYSELTDPLEQRARLEEQSLKAAAHDPEAMEVDDAFLHALEIGIPPTGGLGLGVDRLVMFIVGGTIRDVLAFPLAK